MIEGLDKILEDFNIKTDNISLYESAFTHRSYTNENKDVTDYDRLEFLGDSLLDMIVGDMVFHYFPNDPSGVLSKARSALVSGKTLSLLSREVYNFASIIRYSKGELTNISNHTHVEEDVFEAFLGAVYLDQGYEFVRDIIVKIFEPLLPISLKVNDERNSKGILQEKLGTEKLDYVVVSSHNISPDKWCYKVEVRLGKQILGTGEGNNTHAAEVAAAKDALSKLA